MADSIGESVLLRLSRSSGSQDLYRERADPVNEKPLSLLERVIPEFRSLVTGKRILDFGCGDGAQCIELAKTYNCEVTGLDTNLERITSARNSAGSLTIPKDRLRFESDLSSSICSTFDIVISQDSFEHYSEPEAALEAMTALLKPGGQILLTFGPPWYAPYGSHMHFFCKVPWVNILFSEKTVMSVRSRYRDDGATKYEDVESGLNKMTLGRFERIIANCKLSLTYCEYSCVKKMNWLGKVPLFRELFVNHITAILRK